MILTSDFAFTRARFTDAHDGSADIWLGDPGSYASEAAKIVASAEMAIHDDAGARVNTIVFHDETSVRSGGLPVSGRASLSAITRACKKASRCRHRFPLTATGHLAQDLGSWFPGAPTDCVGGLG
jgi:hypothetical protein